MASEMTVKLKRRRRRRHHKNKNKLPEESEEVPKENVAVDNLKEGVKKILHEEKISKYFETLKNINKLAVPVTSIDEVQAGDVIYFRQVVLKRHRPKLSAFKKAKVFFKMRRDPDPTTTGPNSILFRCFHKFNLGWPADWKLNIEEMLSSEPFILNFSDMFEMSKESPLVL